MRKLYFFAILIFLESCITNKKTPQNQNTNFIDHIPIVVKNLEDVKNIFEDTLNFKIKNGREHFGIKNCFVKFEDGTYLEFISPTDSLQPLGKYYANHLKNNQGATSFAISVKNIDTIIDFLKKENIEYDIESNEIWKTVEPKNFNVFYIDYIDKNWKEKPINTSHSNEAISIKSIFVLENNKNFYAKKYSELGYFNTKKDTFLDIPIVTYRFGKSDLNLLNTSAKANKKLNFNQDFYSGICGLEIKVKSLIHIKKSILSSKKTTLYNGKIIYFLKDYNLFLVFRE